MLNSINITAAKLKNNKSNIGQIAESLLFYREVNYLVKQEDLISLLQDIDTDILIELIDYHNLNIYFVEFNLQLGTKIKGKYNQIGVAFFPSDLSHLDLIWNCFVKKYGNSLTAKKYTKEVISRIKLFKHEANSEITYRILQDYLDKDYLNDSMRAVKAFSIGRSKLPDFEVIRDSDTSYIIKNYKIEPNIKINNELGIIQGLNFLLEARELIEMGALMNSEILTSEHISRVIQLNFNRLKRNVNSVNEFKTFQNVFVNNAANISSLINKSPELLKEYLEILEKSKKFKKWLDNVEDNSSILSEYYQAISSKTWLEKGPVKSFKWIFDIGISTVLGLINPVAGIAYSGLSGVAEKITEKRWKPNMFVDKDLKKIFK